MNDYRLYSRAGACANELIEFANKEVATEQNKKKFFAALTLSLLFHGLIFLLLSVPLRPPLLADDINAPAIQATLYAPPKRNETTQENVDDIPETTLKKEDDLVQPKAEPLVPENAILPPNKEDNVFHSESALEDAELPQNALPLTLQKQKDTSSEDSISSKPTFDSLAKKHLNQLEQNELNKVYEQLSKEYRYKKTHPEIKPVPNASIEEETPIKPLNVDIACDSKLLDKTLGTISGLLNGTAVGEGPVGCNRNYEIDSFINNRVNKKSK